MENLDKFKKVEFPKKERQEWLDALRSGKYQQTGGQLMHSGKYCCLGVLCHINGVNLEDVKVGSLSYPCSLVTAELQDLIPESFPKEFYDDSDYNPNSKRAKTMCDYIMEGHHEEYNRYIVRPLFLRILAELNDRGRSFKKIADIIEQLTMGV